MAALAIVALGSNIEPEYNLPRAVSRLRQLGAQEVSRVYQSPALGGRPQPDFLNAAVRLDTQLEARPLREALRQVEAELGRKRTADKFAPRTIDLDLLLLGEQILDCPDLRLPDPGLLELAHLAVPAAELAPEFVHPRAGETLRTIADRLLPTADLLLRPQVSEQVRLALQREYRPG